MLALAAENTNRLRFHRKQRIQSASDFTEIIRNGSRTAGKCMIMFSRKTTSHARLGISLGRSYGNAVMRNRFKRLVREAFRMSGNSLAGHDIVVIPAKYPRRCLSLEECRSDFRSFTSRSARPEEKKPS